MATLIVSLYSEAFSEYVTEDAPIKQINPKYSPLTASIIAMGLYDVERKHGAAYLVSDETRDIAAGDWFVKLRSEKELLADFWQGASSYDTFVTFNGRSFALPFLLHRSVVHGVRPAVEVARQRYLTKQTAPYHVDLMDELTFYGAIPKEKLLKFAKEYSISCKEEAGDIGRNLKKISSSRVAEIVEETLTIGQLYEKWKKNLAPISFINKVEF